MWYMPLTVGLLLLGPAGAATLQLSEPVNLAACIAQNHGVMGASLAEAYCTQLRDEARARQEAATASATSIERAYQDCVILNRRTMGSLAENYCTQRREETLARREAGVLPTP